MRASGPVHETIANDQQLARCVLYGQFFVGQSVSEALLFRFEGEGPDGSKKESCVWRKYARTVTEVHRIGTAIAVVQNARIAGQRAARGETPATPVAGKDRRYYCGFYQALAGNLRIEGLYYAVSVEHEIENGERSHVTVRLRINDAPDKSARANAKTEARRRLARALHSPEPFVPESDRDDPYHPINKWGADCLAPAA